jgi:uncharacterized protein (DUF2384 family)
MGDDFNSAEFERVVSAAEAIAGSRLAAVAWMDQPLRTLGDHSPAQMVSEGRADAVLAYLASIESGYLG